MLGRLLLLFVLVPLAELALLIQVGRWTGVWTTVALVFLTGILGAGLARAEGLRTLWAFRRDVSEGRVPGRALQDGLSILVGGALLLTPGFLTDVVGFSLLLPFTRRWIQGVARRRLRTMIQEGSVRIMTPADLFGGGPGGPGGARGPGSGAAGRGPARDGPPETGGRRTSGGDGGAELDPENEIVG